MVKLSSQLTGLQPRTERRRRGEEEIRRRRRTAPILIEEKTPERTALDQEIEEEEKKVLDLRKDLKKYDDQINANNDERAKLGGTRNDADRRGQIDSQNRNLTKQKNVIGEQIDSTNARLNILRNSQSLDEASKRESFYKYQQQQYAIAGEEEGERWRAEKKIKELEEKGYKPYIVEKSFKGKPESTELTYYSPDEKKFVTIKTFTERPSVDVSGATFIGLSKAKDRKIRVGKKEFTYPSQVRIYKDPKGEIITSYARTGVTEESIIKKSVAQYGDFSDKETTDSKGWRELLRIDRGSSRFGETYNPELKMFQTPSEASGQATAIFRTPTASEKLILEDVQKRGDWYGKAITGYPAQYLQTLGGITGKQLGVEDIKDIGITKKHLGYLDPRIHWKVFKENYKLQKEIEDFSPLMEKYEEKKEEYEKVRVRQREIDEGTATEEDIRISNEAGAKVNAVIDAMESLESYQSFKKRGKITSIDELAGKTDASKKLRFAYGGAVGTTRILPYIIPATRIVMGADMSVQGIETTMKADTDTQRALGIGQIALGGYLAKTGIKGVMPDPTGKIVSGTTKGIATRKVLTHTAIIGLSGGVGGLSGYQQYKRTGDIYQSVGVGVGTGATLLGGAYFQAGLRRYNDWERQVGREQIKTPKIEDKPFIKKEGKFGKRAVFYKRYEGFKLSDTKTWKAFLKGQKKGSFLYRQYRLVDPLVEGKAKGLKEVTHWTIKNGKLTKVTQETTTFPTDVPKEHKAWFDQSRKITQYYLPQKTLKNILKQHKSFGFSATQKAWKGTEYADDVLTNIRPYGKGSLKGLPKEIKLGGAYQFTSGKGVSTAFLRTGGKESVVIQIGGKPADSPTAYANWFRDSQVNPAIREVRGYSQNLKQDVKFYILKNKAQAGKIQLPVAKGEVEGVYEFARRIPLRSDYYFKFGGRNVMIDEQIFVQSQAGSGSNVDKIVEQLVKKIGGSPSVSTAPTYSSLTSIAYLPSISRSIAYSPPASKVSNIKSLVRSSMLASSVTPSVTPSPSKSIVPSSSSKISSQISKIISSSTTSPPSTSVTSTPYIPYTPPSYTPPPSILPFLKAKIRKKKKKGKTKQIYELAYFPDFTARSIGLKPETLSQKQAQKRLKKLLTGLEIRRGVKIR